MVSAPVSGGACVVDRISMEAAEAIVAAMPTTVILGAARTPVGRLGGGLSSLAGTELGGIAIRAALERAELPPDRVQHVVMGQVLQAGVGPDPSRQAQIAAGIPREVSSETINKVCASGLRRRG
jgi:acetyl-CoA C-acetyltransferase